MATFCLEPLVAFCHVTCVILTLGSGLVKLQCRTTSVPINPDTVSLTKTV